MKNVTRFLQKYTLNIPVIHNSHYTECLKSLVTLRVYLLSDSSEIYVFKAIQGVTENCGGVKLYFLIWNLLIVAIIIEKKIVK